MKNILILFLFILITTSILSCQNSKKSSSTVAKLKLLHTYKLKIPEPSGLSFDSKNKSLWTISDHNSTIYQITLKGKIKNSFKISWDDLEGITVVNDSMIAVVSEKANSVILLDLTGSVLKSAKFKFRESINSGLEGIAYNENNGHYYLLKEKHEGILIECDSSLKEISKIKLNFAKDYSGIFYDKTENQLWIISDENRLLVVCDMKGNPIIKYKLKVPNPEGIAINFETNRIYIVSDSENKLFVFRKKHIK